MTQRASIPASVSCDLTMITEVASRIEHMSPRAAEELRTAVQNLRAVLSELFAAPSAAAQIEEGFARSLNETNLGKAAGL